MFLLSNWSAHLVTCVVDLAVQLWLLKPSAPNTYINEAQPVTLELFIMLGC